MNSFIIPPQKENGLYIGCFICNMIEENCYILWDDSREATIIDCGAYGEEEQAEITRFIRKEELDVKHLYCTHGHFDHVFGNEFLYTTYGIQPEMHHAEEDTYRSAAEMMRLFMHRDYHLSLPEPQKFFNGGDILQVGGHHTLHVIETPGHTPGGVCLYCEEESILFSGDSLFRYSIGRTDLPGGNLKNLTESLQKKVLTLPTETRVFPGHGESTSIGEERTGNPCL